MEYIKNNPMTDLFEDMFPEDKKESYQPITDIPDWTSPGVWHRLDFGWVITEWTVSADTESANFFLYNQNEVRF